MHQVQRDVSEFHRVVCGIPTSPTSATPGIRRPELRAELIREEARETVDAIEAGDLIGAIDGMCDLLCVVYGTATEFGIDLEPFWNEVHRSNMAKAGGPVRGDGKRLKPPGWTPPDIAGVLAAESAAAASGWTESGAGRIVHRGVLLSSYEDVHEVRIGGEVVYEAGDPPADLDVEQQ